MTTVTSNQPWEQRQLNRSGIRRLKLVDANSLYVFPHFGLIPQKDLTFFEFIFPADLSCSATFQLQNKETGSTFWAVNINFSLPHLQDPLVAWITSNEKTLWIAIAEDYNGMSYAFGGMHEGLKLNLQATTGNGPRDTNPMAFTLGAEQLRPYTPLPDYEDSELFSNTAGFSYGFSTGFNA